MPAERAIRRARAAVADQHRGRNARGTPAAGARRVIDGPGGGERRGGIQYLDSFGGSPHSHSPVCQL
jgi:hypothetical protein